jgi:imidazole glycerol-phosphate synthase subunit HisF
VRPRVIPVLLLDRARRLVKTRRFADEVYVGDPFNVIRIFNEKEVDEICVLDIHATVDGRDPDVSFIRALATECFMPLTYGGGVRTVADCEALVSAGVEKVLIGSAAPAGGLIGRVAKEFGTQAVAVSVDVTQRDNRWEVRTHRGRRHVADDAVAYARRLVDEGAGEILLHNIDRDGCREGYDLTLVSTMARAVSVPVVCLGGAGSYTHLREGLIAGASAVASGSTFVFIGRLRAVLITYPTSRELIRDVLPLAEEAQ